MHYNLLGYRTIYGGCNTTTNNLNTKDANIIKILNYVKPDIFTVNEMGSETGMVDRLLNNCLNTGGVTSYSRANVTNYENSSIINMLYYNNQKFTLEGQDVVNQQNDQDATRDINIYKLKYKTLDISGNPIYLKLIVAHLRAAQSEANLRAKESNYIMSYVTAQPEPENLLVLGDFNIYSSTEQAFINFVNPPQSQFKLNDPIASGTYYPWGASVHTQSTHADNNNCASPGGMDDRFDFILASNPVMHSTNRIAYISNSYMAVGQDGNHLDKSINDGYNSAVPADIADALYIVSDHLPVSMKIKIDPNTSINNLYTESGIVFRFINPVVDNLELFVSKSNNQSEKFSLEIYNLIGQEVYSDKFEVNTIEYKINFSLPNLTKGVYVISLTDSRNNKYSRRLIYN